ncbi:MAG: class I SAM-dependent methyltransferase [Myxococcales bacterium FL481]|nr:MAG: class I SAM-dependent methyltransferase [Myxococcales bacterium FL481]
MTASDATFGSKATSSNDAKHQSRNPLQRFVIDRFHREIVNAVQQTRAETVLDVGCGEGYTLAALRDGGIAAKLSGVELSGTAVEQAKRRLGAAATVWQGDARELSTEADSRYDLVMMLEVLEHLDRPEQMLPILERLTNRFVLLSVPWEPLFRGANLLRGRHLSRLGNHPEHVNLWSRSAFLEFVSQRFNLVATPMAAPWTIALAERRG